MDDLISRQAAIETAENVAYACDEHGSSEGWLAMLTNSLEVLPPAQPEQHEIGYSECANSMLKMWIDNVLTDGEYNRIMDKLNAHWAERREG